MKRKIRLTESELINLIKNAINEQEEYTNFINAGGFRNCRGIRLRDSPDNMMKIAHTNRFEPGSMDAMSSKEERKAQKELDREDAKELKEFNAANGTKIDLTYYRILRDDVLAIKNRNANPYYKELFDKDGKPFTDNLNQNKLSKIEGIFKSGDNKIFYFKDVFGNKNPSIMDLYNYMESIGGFKKYKELDETGYEPKKFIEKLQQRIEEFNDYMMKTCKFVKPSGKTPFVFIWYENKLPKFRYFNTIEEWKLALSMVEQEGNKNTGVNSDMAGSTGEATFGKKPSGEFSSKLVN